MELPKIKNKDLPKELKEILGDADAEFEAIVDPTDVINIELNPDEYYKGRTETAKMLIESRQKLEQLRHDFKRHVKTVQENNQSTQEE